MVFDTFTAANTAKGFFCYFDELLYNEQVNQVYLIKGGPGCGKSTFMKKVANAFDQGGFTIERIRCSSDKDSLDGIHIIEKGIVIIDATAPHAYDMRYPGAYESLIDLSKFWDESILKKDYENIKILTDGISAKYRHIYCLLKAAGTIDIKITSFIESICDNAKITSYIKKIIKQNALPRIESKPKVTNRMLSAFSGEGIYTLSQTDEKLCDEYIVLEDLPGIGHIFLAKAANVFTKLGYDTLKIHCPLCPESKIEQVLIPQLRLGIITTKHLYSPEIDQSKITKKIITKTAINKTIYSQNKNKLTFEKKLIGDILGSVYKELEITKKLHDELENYYSNAVDYDKVNDFTDKFIKNIY